MLAARCVQPEEKERILQFMFKRDAKAAMVGRLLIRKLVCTKVGLPWDGFHLARTPKGKPFLVHPSPESDSARWNFNVSHQGDFALLAAEQGKLVGIDVMKTTAPGSGSVQEFFRLMKRQFTDVEWKTIRTAESDWDQLHMFYRHWALKESFIKAIGSGLSFDLQRVEFHPLPYHMQEGSVYSQTTMHLDQEEESNWTFEECLLDEHHHIAVAVEKAAENSNASSFKKAVPPPFTLLTFNELIAKATPLSDEDPLYWESFRKKQEAPERQSEMR